MYLSQTEYKHQPQGSEAESPQEVAETRPRRQSALKRAAYWTVVLGVCVFLAWHILALGIAEYYAEKDPGKALVWDAQHPVALRNQAARVLESAPDQANRLLQQALRQNPADARAYVMLAWLREQAGKTESARQLIERASILGPRQWLVQMDIAAFWARQQRLDLAVQGWNIALQMRGGLAKELFPMLLKIAEHPDLRQALLPLARTAPPWWSGFFVYAARNASQLETLRVLYPAQQKEDLTAQERQAFLTRLQQEGQWEEAYFTWLNALDKTSLQALGNLFNGRFELPLSNEGFGWRFSQPRGVEIKTASTYGMEGEQALQIAFFGQRVRFQHLSQPLLLAPGAYELTGKVRLDNLETAKGLQWKVYCLAPIQQEVAASGRFVGASLWRPFDLYFEVPKENCTVQLLRLELLGRAPADFEVQGSAWFDALAIERVEDNWQGRN